MRFSQVEKTCPTCGIKFMVHNFRKDEAIYCSRKCVKKTYKHGLFGTRIYRIYQCMIQRCENPNHRNFKNYGGRGIRICDEWRSSVVVFAEWAMANGYRDDLELDRKDPNGNYEPGNCRFASRADQNRNTRKKRLGRTTSPYKGVFQNRGSTKWRAAIRRKGHSTYLGTFDTQEAAAHAYDAAAKEEFGEFAHLNFPEA